MKNTGIIIASMLGGLIVGSAITMLLTPQSGPELRGKIKEFIDEEMEKARCKCDEKGHCECKD